MNMKRLFFIAIVLAGLALSSCGVSKNNTAVVRPRYHKVWPTQKWRIDIPIGARHIRMLGRKRTQTVRMN